MLRSTEAERSDAKQNLNRTRLCKYYKKGSWCFNGKKCTFAHGEKSLVERPNFARTQVCKYFQQGRCKHDNCPFAHGFSELRDAEVAHATSESFEKTYMLRSGLQDHSAGPEHTFPWHGNSAQHDPYWEGGSVSTTCTRSDLEDGFSHDPFWPPVSESSMTHLRYDGSVAFVDCAQFKDDAYNYAPSPACIPLPFAEHDFGFSVNQEPAPMQ
eukprot:TRINITY_DN57_c0_g3_i1.p1 TRINITY_DN57_c0_g3~~TRINITY_DN57_c0_g3_i1.p1  ORF type:complete len:212 (-),score=20.66 TRINITY_DN57_c0_g3_i1:299-934(-)